MLYISSFWRTYWSITLIIEFVDCGEIITKKNCTEDTIKGMKCMTCYSGKVQITLDQLPSDLGADITCLYMDNFLIPKIGKEAFEKYPSLTHLHMIREGFSDIAKNTLDPLKGLLYLNFTNVNWFENTEITWPTTLRILDVTRLKINTLVAPDLHLLEVVNVSGTQLTEFPTLSEKAPLKLIVLHHIRMTNFKLDTFAKYCKLQSLSMLNFTLGNNCQCLQMKEALKEWHIQVIHDLDCKPDSNCTLEFSETSKKNRDHCLSQSSLNLLFGIIIVSIVILILLMAGASYVHEKLLKIEEEEGLGGAATQNPLTKISDEDEEEAGDDDD